MWYVKILFIIAFVSSLNAQTLSLEKGESGIGANLFFGKSNKGTSKSFSFGYSNKGVLGLKIGVNDFIYSEKLFNSELSRNSINIGVDFIFLKEQSNIPLSLGFTADYIVSDYSNNILESFNNKAKSDYYNVGILLSRGFSISENLKVRPVISGEYTWGKSSVTGNPVILEIIDEDLFSGLIVSMFEYSFEQMIFVFSPSIQLSKYSPYYYFGISLIYDFE